MSDRLYIRGFPSTYTASDLKLKFSEFGPVKKSYIVSKVPLLYGIIRYYNPDNTQKAIEALNNQVENEITWYVAMCENKCKRRIKIYTEFRGKKLQNLPKTLFLKDFPTSCTEQQLKEIFEKHGKIESVKINKSKAFITFEEASTADTAKREEKKLIIYGTRVYVTKLVKIHNLSYLIDKKKNQKQQKTEEVKDKVSKENDFSDDDSQRHPKESSEAAESSNSDSQDDLNPMPEPIVQQGIFRYCTLL